MRKLASAYASLVAATVVVLVVKPAADALGLRQLRASAPTCFDGADALRHVNIAIAAAV